MPAVHIHGHDTLLGRALAERLERADIELSESATTTIVCWEGAGTLPESCDLLIRPAPLPSPPCTADCEIVLTDLYIPGGSGRWGPQEIYAAVDWHERGGDGYGERDDEADGESVTDGESVADGDNESGSGNAAESGPDRWWLHVRDLLDAVILLIDNPASGVLQASGRRGWPHAVLLSELTLLWSRLQAVRAHSLSAADLAPAATNLDAAVDRSTRPDLAPLHSALQQAGGDGWHPVVPFRVGLMECIAARVDT